MSDIKNFDILFPNSGMDLTQTESTTTNSSTATEGMSFSEILESTLTDVNALQHDSRESVQMALSGDSSVDIAETMVALQKADASLKMTLEVRNKLLTAYQELIKTQI